MGFGSGRSVDLLGGGLLDFLVVLRVHLHGLFQIVGGGLRSGPLEGLGLGQATRGGVSHQLVQIHVHERVVGVVGHHLGGHSALLLVGVIQAV